MSLILLFIVSAESYSQQVCKSVLMCFTILDHASYSAGLPLEQLILEYLL